MKVTGFPTYLPEYVDNEPVWVDDAGVGYVRLSGTDPARPSLLIAFDAATGTERWRHEGTATAADSRLLAGLPDGVLLERVRNGERTVAAIGATGTVRWQVPVPQAVGDYTLATVDAARNQVYVTGMRGANAHVWNATTGATMWTAPTNASLLSVGRVGALWAVESPGRHRLRVTDSAGRTTLVWDSLAPVRSAIAAGPDEIYVGTDGAASMSAGLLTRLRTRGPSAPAARHEARLMRDRPDPRGCDMKGCRFTGREGRLLRVSAPRGGAITITLRASGRFPWRRTTTTTVPRGIHWVRLPSTVPPPMGALHVRVRWADGTVRDLRLPSHTALSPRAARRT